MKVLIIKMSSMGDIIHTFPALTDAGHAIDGIRFDWMVEESLQELPKWHPLVDKVFSVALRRWRKHPVRALLKNEIPQIVNKIRKERYDLVIDAQGLLKSAIATLFCRGLRCSFDKKSSKESWINFIYQKKYSINTKLHAVNRIRQLFSNALEYPLSANDLSYGITRQEIASTKHEEAGCNTMLFLPNTTWQTKHWPEEYWRELIKTVTDGGWRVKLPWGNEEERARVERLAEGLESVTILPKLSLTEIGRIIAGSKAVVALDTGLAHVAAAFSVPAVTLYGPTDPGLTGALGVNQEHIKAHFRCAPCFRRQCSLPQKRGIKPPCFATLPPQLVWSRLRELLEPPN